MRIILGSSSPGRRKILSEMGYSFEVVEPNIDEKAIQDPDPRVLATKRAVAKSEEIRSRIIGEPAILITADQVVTCGGSIWGKPAHIDEAREYLRRYRKLAAVCVTAVGVCETRSGRFDSLIDEAAVWFKELDDAAIEKLVTTDIVFSCAGGFAIDHPAFHQHVDRIKGDRDSVIGLPKRSVRLLLARLRWAGDIQ